MHEFMVRWLSADVNLDLTETVRDLELERLISVVAGVRDAMRTGDPMNVGTSG